MNDRVSAALSLGAPTGMVKESAGPLQLGAWVARKAAKPVGGALGSAAGKLGRMFVRASKANPLAMGMGAVSVPFLGAEAGKTISSRSQASMPGINTLAHAGRVSPTWNWNKPMTKLSSQAITAGLVSDDLRLARCVARGLQKEAAAFTIPKLFGAAVALGVAGSLVGIGQQAGQSGLGTVLQMAHGLKREPQYRKMLVADPTLREEPMAKNYFNVLFRASPYLASEPLLAASTVRHMLSSPPLAEGAVPGVRPTAVKELLDIQEKRRGAIPGVLTRMPPKAQAPPMAEITW